MMRAHAWLLIALAAGTLAACSASEAPEQTAVTASVEAVPARQGSLPERITAYGSAAPATDASRVINVQVAGQVEHWNVMAGATVKRGQPLLTFALAPSAIAAYQQAVTAEKVAAAARTHASELLAQQLATRDQMEQADKALADARETLNALVQSQGKNATLDVVAPFDGTVASVDASQGELLQPGAPLLSLQRGDGLVVVVGVEREAVARVQAGAEVTLTPLDDSGAMRGTVRRIAHSLNAHTHQLDVEVVPEGTPVAGESFRADIVVGQWQGWLLPRDALQGEEGHRHVFQIAKDKAVSVPVKVVGESDSQSVVSGALDAHLPLVTTGATQLDDGMAVRVATDDHP